MYYDNPSNMETHLTLPTHCENQQCWALIFSSTSAITRCWRYSRVIGDLRRRNAHASVTVMDCCICEARIIDKPLPKPMMTLTPYLLSQPKIRQFRPEANELTHCALNKYEHRQTRPLVDTKAIGLTANISKDAGPRFNTEAIFPGPLFTKR